MPFKTFDKISEIIGWLQIVVSLFLLGSFIGFIVYYFCQNNIGLIAGILISITAFVGAIFYANKIWKTKGTVWFISRVSATPELDEETKTEKNN